MKISEIFYSIQGEGPCAGIPTVFVRTFGCNLRCLWCDTKYAVVGEISDTAYKVMTEEEIIEEIQKHPQTNHVCITGGEPLIQDLSRLVEMLVKSKYFVYIETNGTIQPTIRFAGDNIRSVNYVISPKQFDKPAISVIGIMAYKFVYDGTNAKTIHDYIARNGLEKPLCGLMPLTQDDEHKDRIVEQMCIDECLRAGLRFMSRLHKIYDRK